ncbi:MAG: BrnT family toxin [Rhodospirillales bacterium]|nr:BrnT family toxin [Rhodospirillales bacterium]
MEFEWDDAKALSNLAKHGIAFAGALKVFFDPRRIEFKDTRRDYGEERFQAIGNVEGVLVQVVYALRGENVRIISARRATRLERSLYGQNSAI